MSSHNSSGGGRRLRASLIRSGAALLAGLTAVSMLIPASTASAADIERPNAELGYPTFNGEEDPIPDAGVDFDPSTSYLKQVFDRDVADGAGSDTEHDFWIDQMLARYGAEPTGAGANEAGEYQYEGADCNQYLFTRGRAAYMYTHTPGAIGFVGNAAYWDQTAQNGFTVTVELDGVEQRMREDTSRRKQTPSYFTTVFTNDDDTLTITEVKYITTNNVMVANLAIDGTAGGEVTLTAESPFATAGENGADELTGRVNATNNLTTLFPRFSGNGFSAQDGTLVSTLELTPGKPQTTKIQLGLITEELPDSTVEYEARFDGDLTNPDASYQDSVTTYNQWWYENIPYVETPEHNIDKTVFYRWWLARFNMIDANMPGNTFQYPTSIEGVLGYNNQIVLTSGMFINDTKWLRNAEYSYGTWISAGQTAKKGQSGYYYYHDNPGDPANWNHSYTQYITKAGWDSYKVHGGPSSLAELLGDQGSQDVKGLLASKTEPDTNDNQNDNDNYLIDWSWNSMTGNDADAVSFSQYPGERMDRADGSANMWANATAAAEAYKAAGMDDESAEMQQIADSIKSDVLEQLWDDEDKLVRHRFIGKHDGELAEYKEINNYYPYSVGLMPTDGDEDYDADYEEALRLFADADEFPVFPFFTANQADKAALDFPGSNNFSIINATPLLQIYAAGIRDYGADDNGYITNEQFKKLLYWVAFAHYQGGDNRYPDQNEFWNMDNNPAGGTIPEKNADASENGGKITYRSWIHHTQLGTTNWTIIEDVAGVVPREDNKIELNPIAIPGWEHFAVNNLSYHGTDMSVVWNDDGAYEAPEGYTLYLDGKAVFTSDRLAHLIYDPETGTVEVADDGDADVTMHETVDVVNANQVTYGSDDRVTDILAKAGHNVDASSSSQTNVAEGATVEATYEADGYPAANAVDGTTVMESFWGTSGSPNAKDTITVTFANGEQTIDDVRVYFYQTSSSQTISGYREPSVYTLEYRGEDGQWHAMERQVRTPAYSGANYNRIQFTPVTTGAIRATFTPQAGQAVGLKEIQAFDTGITPEEEPTNQAPTIDAYVGSTTSSGARLVGTVKDDGQPNGILTTRWEQVSGPDGGTASFADATAASTVVTFNREGDYELKLTASDGELSATATLTVHGIPSDGTVNIATQAEAEASSRNSYPIGDVGILNDGVVDLEGADAMKSWNNWGQNDAEPWVQYTWDGKVPLAKVQAYFWSDGNGVPMPDGWKVQYRDDDGEWRDVTLKNGQSYDVVKGEGVSVSFETVWTDAMRIAFTPKSGPEAVGLSELEAYAVAPNAIETVNRVVKTGSSADGLDLPGTVSAAYNDGSRADLTVSWGAVSDEDLAVDGDITVPGTVIGAMTGTTAAIAVRSDADSLSLNAILDSEQTVYRESESFTPPATVTVRYQNGALQSGIPVTWDADELSAVDLTTVGDYTVTGGIDGSEIRARLTVHVVEDPAGGTQEPEPDPEPLEGWIEGLATKVTTDVAASWSPADDKLNDGILIDETWPDGDDQDVNRYVWGTWGVAKDGMYAEYQWADIALIDQARVQFWANFAETDEERGGLEIPDDWEIQYRDADGDWVPVIPAADGGYATVRNSPAQRGEGEGGGWSTVTFEPVETDALRLVLTPHHPSNDDVVFGTAVAEWGVHAIAQESVDPEPEPEPVDKTALKAAIDAAKSLDSSRFTPESWQLLVDALADAQAVYDDADATAEAVADAIARLEDAQKNLVEAVVVDKTALNAAIEDALQLGESWYTADSWKVFADALAAARKVADDESATQARVDEATQTLIDAQNALVRNPAADKVDLDNAIMAAEQLKQNGYTADSWKVFADALAAAKAVSADEHATSEQIADALANLIAAQEALVAVGGSGAGTGAGSGALSATGAAVVGIGAVAIGALAIALVIGARRRNMGK